MNTNNEPYPVAHFFAQMMSVPQSFKFVRQRCLFWEQMYAQAQEVLLRQADQAWPILYGQIAAHELAWGSLLRLHRVALDVRRYEDEAMALSLLIEGLTREIAFLGHAYERVYEEVLPPPSTSSGYLADVQQYHQAQRDPLSTILYELGLVLAPLLTNLVIGHMGWEQVHILDTEPYRSDFSRREAVAAACQHLADENKLDRTYATIAYELAKIDFPSDIYSDEDRYRRHALPTHVNRLYVADLLTFIATIKAEHFAAASAHECAFIGCSCAAQHLVDRRGAEIPVPERTMWVDLPLPSDERLKRAGIVARHEEPCPFCRTHCTIRRVTFPEGTHFGKATQTELYEQREHSYSFYPQVPSALPDGFIISLDYSGVWEPDRPWTLMLIDANEDVIPS
ncbi:MAG: hypothetical protein H0V70_25875 [Ktedonobacteraceae bacterium]|nr:hypothetical protein [Ktedonobacteraceae bacterium]